MRLSKYRPTKETRLELSTTSMIDVVFLLLIFFLVTTTFLTPERQLKPNIQVQNSATTSVTDVIEPAFIDVIQDNGVPVYRLGTTITSNLEIVSDVLERYPDKSRGAFVRLSDNCPFGMAAAAISRCRQAGFHSVSLIPNQ